MAVALASVLLPFRSFALNRLRIMAYRDGVGAALQVTGHFRFKGLLASRSLFLKVCAAHGSSSYGLQALTGSFGDAGRAGARRCSPGPELQCSAVCVSASLR